MSLAGTPAASRCSFCDKRREEVKLLIAGPNGVCICDECVDLVWMIVHKRQGRHIHSAGQEGGAGTAVAEDGDGEEEGEQPRWGMVSFTLRGRRGSQVATVTWTNGHLWGDPDAITMILLLA